MNAPRTSAVDKGPAGILGWSASGWRGFWLRAIRYAWALLLLVLLIPLEDTHPGATLAVYNHAWQLFLHGKLPESQREATASAQRFQGVDPAWASKFQLLQADSMLYRGMIDEPLVLLAAWRPDSNHPEGIVEKLAIEAVALTHKQQLSEAGKALSEAEAICEGRDYAPCGEVLRARGLPPLRLAMRLKLASFI